MACWAWPTIPTGSPKWSEPVKLSLPPWPPCAALIATPYQTTTPKLTCWSGVGRPPGWLRDRAQCHRRHQKPKRSRAVHTGLLWAAALSASSTSRSQSKSTGVRDRGETASIPGLHSGKRVKGSLGLWRTTLLPICSAKL